MNTNTRQQGTELRELQKKFELMFELAKLQGESIPLQKEIYENLTKKTGEKVVDLGFRALKVMKEVRETQ